MARIHRELEVPLAWHWVESIRRTVADELASYDQELRDAAEMVASELAENVVRYGRPIGTETPGVLTLLVEDGLVSISSRNGASAAQAAQLLEIVRRMKEGDAEALAIERLKRMLSAPTEEEGSQLGLLRIAYEGGFTLDAAIDGDGVLTVSAKRKIA